MVVVIHAGLKCKDLGIHFLSFDFFEPKTKKKRREMGYKTECDVAKRFLEEFPGLEYRGSEDLAHADYINMMIIAELIKGKHKVYVYDECEDKFREV